MKKMLKSSLSIFLAVTIIFSSAYVGLGEIDWYSVFGVKTHAASESDLSFTWNIYSKTYHVSACDESASGAIIIPSLFNGKPVTNIADRAFYNCRNLTSITIPDSVTGIGGRAFEYCTSLTSVTIPDSVISINNSAFASCTNLTSIVIPDTVTSIGGSAFSHCGSLISIVIPDSVTTIGDDTFHNCTSLTSVTIPDSVMSIGDSAFEYCTSLTSVTIPDSVMSIGDSAFEYCTSLTSVTLSDSVTSIGYSAFGSCTSLTSVTIPDSVTSIDYSAFEYCTSLTSVTLPDSVTSISGDVFYSCESLTSITIPDSVTSIGSSAFYNCKSIKSITIPGSVTSIGEKAFFGCVSLKSIVLSNGLTDMGNYAFSDCTSLETVTIPDTVTNMGDGVFEECKKLNSAIIGNNVPRIGSSVFSYCENLSSITIGSNVKEIGYDAFYNCNFSSVTIPYGVISIGSGAFKFCENLSIISIPDSVTSIGSDAFAYTAYDTSDNYENGVLYIDNHLVATDYWLSGSCTVKSGTITIADSAFEGSEFLASITIPDSVITVGDFAFEGCSKLKTVKIGNGVTNIGNKVFNGCSALASVTIPDSVTSIGEFSFSDCENLSSITIPESVMSIGAAAFYYCTKLSSIFIPVSVINIDAWAFNKCTKLETVYYSGSKDQWDSIVIGDGNEYLISANIIFNSSGNSELDEPFVGKFTVAQKYGDATSHKYDYEYKDSYFDKSATEYNHELATMSLCLALSTYQSEENSITYQNVKKLLKECGFDSFKPYNYTLETSADNVGCLISRKPLGNETLISVAVRSGGYDKEWASNLTVGYSGDHQGFDEASDIVLDRIKSYIKGNNISGNVKFWITGYSRGAATATQTAAKLNYTSIDGVSFTKDKIYAYGFATPAGAIKSSDPTNTEKYGNIFNIVNFHDIVPKVAPEGWDFTRYGKTFYLPFSDSSDKCHIKEESVKKWFEENGLSYKLDNFVAYYYEYGDGKFFGGSNDSLGVFSSKLISSISNAITSRYVYTSTLQSSIRSIWTNKTNFSLPLALVEILDVLVKELAITPQYISTAIAANSLLVEAHAQDGAYYLGWMQTMPSNLTEQEYKSQGYFTTGSLRKLIANCPVDVYVYDVNGELVAAIENDEPVSIKGSTFSYGVDENGQKYFYLPVDAEYNVTVKAREDCETTCTINEFSADSFTESRVLTYTEIPMKKGEEVLATSGEYSDEDILEGTENGSSADYTVQREDEQIIEPDVDVAGEEIENYTYNVTVEFDENQGIVYGGGTFTIGQFCQVTAENKPGYKFNKWTVNGETVSTDSTYRFAVKENVTIVAEYVPCEHPKYVDEVVAPTCTEDGYTKHTCEVCTYSYNDTTVKAKGHTHSGWIIDKKATVNAKGKKHKECTECGEVLKTATIKQLKCSKAKLKTIANTSSGVKITWGKVSGADSYEVYRKVKGGSYSKVGTTRKTYFTDKTAKSGKTYYYVVKAVNEAGKSSNSNYKTIKYLADPVLKTPTSAKKGITLKWSKVTGAQGYEVYRKTGNGSYSKLATVKGASKVSYVDKTAKKNKKYTYKVKSYYGKTYSAFSNTKTIKDKY